jgi:flagellar hook-length control protein FliK
VTTGPASPLEQAAARSVVANGVAEASAAMSASLAAAPLPSTTSLLGAAGTTGALSTSPAALPSHIAELARSAQISADGSARLVVRLDPPELGAVTLHLRSRGSEVEMSLHADTAGGASALADQQARVRDVLAAHGFDLSRFTIAGRGSDTASGDGTGRDGRPADGRTGAGDFSAPGRDQNGRAAGSAFADFDGSGGSGSRRGAGSRGYPTRSGTTAPDASRGAAAPTQGVWL